MFPQMRRFRQELKQEENLEILQKTRTGVLALADAKGNPYSLPMNFIYLDGKLIFHCANEGYKLELIRENPKASFCVMEKNELVLEEYTTYFRSVLVFGSMTILEDDEKRIQAMRAFTQKLRPGFEDEMEAIIERNKNAFVILEMTVDHMTGKQAVELVNKSK